MTPNPSGLEPVLIDPRSEPLVCIPVNRAWIAILIGAVNPLRYPEYWGGTLEENRQMRAYSRDLIESIMSYGDCGDMTPPTNCCVDITIIEHRVNSVTLQLEISVDGGATWQPDPTSPIVQMNALPSAVTEGGTKTKCDAATDGKAHIEDQIAACHEWLSTAVTVFDLAVGVCLAILELAVAYFSGLTLAAAAAALASTIWNAAHAAFTYGVTAFDSYWTTDEKDKILCAIYCHIGDDGKFTNDQYLLFLQDWKARATPSPAFNLVYDSVRSVGLKGMNNMLAYGEAAEADCSDCTCGCDLDNWSIWEGEGTSFTTGSDEFGDYLEAVAVYDGANFGGYVVAFTTNNPAICCLVNAVATTGTPETGTWFFDNCGESITPLGTAFPHTGLSPGGLVNTVGHNGLTPFTWRLYLA